MDNTTLKHNVISLLKSLPVCKEYNGGTNYMVRCPFCGDSIKSTDHGHLSIKINLDDDSPMIYRCFRCTAKGIVNTTLLNELGLNISEDAISTLNNFNKSLTRYNKFNFTTVPDYIVPVAGGSNNDYEKLDYVNNRLGTFIDLNTAADLNIVINPYEFFVTNDIKNLQVDLKILKILQKEYVGFLSTNRNTIVFRNMKDNNNYRYFKMKINPNFNNPNGFYTVSSSIDLLYTNKIDIHIAEGTFDILSILYNVNNGNLENNFYFASCGFGFSNILKYILNIGLNTGLTIHIYSDKDKSDKDHYSYLNPMKYAEMLWYDNLYIHRNAYKNEYGIVEKDYGVRKEFIIDTKKKIK